jgi:ATP-binding cassette subfamily F protein uup
MSLLSLNRVRLTLGGPLLLDNVDLNVEEGERVCILGRNGEGKSSLMRLVTGELSPNGGEIITQKGARVTWLPQEVPENLTGRTFDIVAGTDSDRLPDYEVDAVLHRLGLDSEADFSVLSGGQKRRVLLARALAGQPDLLLLDEPTNHLDIESIDWLEEFLQKRRGALLFVTHDRAFLQKLATRIVELDRGKLLNWPGDYNEYVVRKAASLEAEAKANADFDKKLAQEEVWLRKGIKARQTRNEGRVRALQELRSQRRARRELSGPARIETQNTDRSGHVVAEAKHMSFAYDDKVIARDLTVRLMRGDKVGFIGPNGCGKTTLLKLLLGNLEPQSGSIKMGTRLQLAYIDQMRAALDPEKTVRENVADENDTVLVNGERRHIIGYLQEWLFSPERARIKAGVLSGGERNRLLLAKLFTQPSNVLVLDEPTNDLDLETLELLEDVLVNYPGTLLLVSHDRAFLNNVVTSTIAPLGDGEWREYIGGYDDWVWQRKAEAKAEAQEKAQAKAQVFGKNKTPQNVTAPAASAASKSTNSRNEKQRKLSFKENRELEELPAHIEQLENEHVELAEKLADPALYKGDGAEVARLNARLQELEATTLKTYERWEQLEAIRIASAQE